MITIFGRSDLSHLFSFLQAANRLTSWQENFSKTRLILRELASVIKQIDPSPDRSERIQQQD